MNYDFLTLEFLIFILNKIKNSNIRQKLIINSKKYVWFLIFLFFFILNLFKYNSNTTDYKSHVKQNTLKNYFLSTILSFSDYTIFYMAK